MCGGIIIDRLRGFMGGMERCGRPEAALSRRGSGRRGVSWGREMGPGLGRALKAGWHA